MGYKILIKGIVQGVGFRPTVYKIAKSLNLKGYVLNSTNGVEIVVDKKDEFLKELNKNLPPLAKIDEIKIKEIDVSFDDFFIKSSKEDDIDVGILPDVAICEDCLKELFDNSNRRYLYPFINCTNCGPRFSIIKKLPYDRENTSFSKFKMCKECEKEYKNPLDRRYHAQPISCYNCGPKLRTSKKFESEIEKIEYIAKKIKNGNIVAIKSIGGFNLVCDATNNNAVMRLREEKSRAKKPFAVMFKNLEILKEYVEIENEEIFFQKEAPIVLLKKKKELKDISYGDKLGVFLPYNAVYKLLFEFIDTPLVVTSANLKDEPIITNIEKLNNIKYDDFLDNDIVIENFCDDSVVGFVKDKMVIFRLSRGFGPKNFYIKKNKLNILATGANQKVAPAFLVKNRAVLAPYVGNLETLESIKAFEKRIDLFKRVYNFEEDFIVCDLHPYYETTKWAFKQQKRVIQIQHHFAHALSVMFEYNLDGEYLAFVFDGTGYGDDKTIWGGEVLKVSRNGYERLHYIKPFKLIGGEKAIKNPANMAVALINEELAQNYSNYEISKKLKNAPFVKTSSMGRVFDMVAFLSGMIEKNEWEGLSGAMIEKYYNSSVKEYVDLEISKISKEIDITPLLNMAAENRKNYSKVASIFLNSIANMIKKISKMYDLKVIVSGGVFQNLTLMELIYDEIDYFNSTIPINDNGISIGQLAYGLWNAKNFV